MFSKRRFQLIYLILILTLAACMGEESVATHTQEPSQGATPSMTMMDIPTDTPVPPTLTSEITTQPQLTSTPMPVVTRTLLPANVQVMPDTEAYTWELVAEGFSSPVALVSSMDGSDRLFVAEQQGVVRIIQDGEALPGPFMDLRDRVSTSGGVSRGLLGLVFHPHYADNGYFFVHYTNSSGNSVIARYNVSDDPNITDHQSEFGLLEIEYPIGEHIGGDLAFGPDGYLYISIGDGGGPGDGDQEGNAQNLDSLLGKLLRIDVDGGEPYHIPVDNPFAFGGGKPEVWVSGLRNPWRFSFDPLTGDTYIADVGENQREELNYLPADMPGGANMGWNYHEGSRSFRGEAPDSLIFIYPLVEYDHMEGCSITGGSVYRGTDLPDWYGVYIYGDYCQGKVWGLLQKPDGSWENELLYKLPAFITSFGQDEAGEIYLVDMTGKIYKLVESDTPK